MTTRNFAPVGVGYHPDYIGGIVWNRTGATLAVGELLMLDMLGADAGSSVTAAPGADSYPLANALTPTTAGIGALSASTGVIFCVVDDLMGGTGADDTQVHVCFKGVVPIKAASTVGAGEFGKSIVGANAVRTFTATLTVGLKQIGKLLQNTTTANTNATVLFNGVEGFGNAAAS